MIFGIVERGNNMKNILGLILSINLHYDIGDNVVCFVSCSPKTKEFIEEFPYEIKNVKIVYFLFAEDNEMKGMEKLFNILYAAIKKYGECCFLDTHLLLMNKFTINDTIREQGIGIVKYATVRTHIREKLENYSFSAQILYVNKLEIVDRIKQYYSEDDPEQKVDLSNNTIDLTKNVKIDASCNVIDNSFISKDASMNAIKGKVRRMVPVFLKDEYNLTEFFEKYTLIDIQEFTAFDKNIKEEQLSAVDFTIEEKKVCFLSLMCNTMDPRVVKILQTLMAKAAYKDLRYMTIINLKKGLMPIIQPKREGVYKWDRTCDPSGMYQLTEMMADNEYMEVKEAVEDYFVVGNNILMDKASDYYISNRSSMFSSFYLCNYSKNLTDALDSIKKPYQFFAYYSEYPRILEEFTKDKTFEKNIDYVELKDNKLVFHNDDRIVKSEPCERSDDYKSFLHQLKNVKYGYCSEGDIHLVATYLSLNIVPVVDSDWLLDLERGVHYETKEGGLMGVPYEEYVINIEKYVKSNIKAEGLLRKLMSHIFVGHV